MATLTKIESEVLMTRPLKDWQPILAKDCQVYQFENGNFLAKRFEQIQYSFCDKRTATDIVVDNLYTLLLEKYFIEVSDEALDRIAKIVGTFTRNLKSSLFAVTFNKENAAASGGKLRLVHNLPDGCMAFRNGVYDFRNDKWLFKYDITQLLSGLKLIEYDLEYIVRYYINIEFEPIPFNLNRIGTHEFIDTLKLLNKSSRNLCFELVYNMSFNEDDVFSQEKFEHLCEILGYTCLNSFSQYFVILFGSGQNGKNSLFDGCFSSSVIPRPVSNDLQSIEEDNFITGSLEGACHNIFLEAEAKTYRCSKNLKQLTGSDMQTIEHKGVGKYPGIINCKFIFAGNEREDIKFTDTSNGFIRRVNVITIPYTYDRDKTFLTRGAYYDTTFSDDLHELKEDKTCIELFVYLAMYGTKLATANYTHSFRFTHNEWSTDYSDIDDALKSKLESISLTQMLVMARESSETIEAFGGVLYGPNRRRIYTNQVDSSVFQFDSKAYERYCSTEGTVSFVSIDDFLTSTYNVDVETDDGTDTVSMWIADDFIASFKELYIDAEYLMRKLGYVTMLSFTKAVRKIYGQSCMVRLVRNRPYFRCTFIKGRLQILK